MTDSEDKMEAEKEKMKNAKTSLSYLVEDSTRCNSERVNFTSKHLHGVQ